MDHLQAARVFSRQTIHDRTGLIGRTIIHGDDFYSLIILRNKGTQAILNLGLLVSRRHYYRYEGCGIELLIPLRIRQVRDAAQSEQALEGTLHPRKCKERAEDPPEPLHLQNAADSRAARAFSSFTNSNAVVPRMKYTINEKIAERAEPARCVIRAKVIGPQMAENFVNTV